MKIKALNYSSCMSDIIGCVTSYLVSSIKKDFPLDYFKYVHVSRSLASIEQSQKNDIYNKNKPTLIINPRWEMEASVMDPHPAFFNPSQMIFKNLRRYYNKILIDRERNIGIYGCPDRIKVEFDIQIVLESEMEAINMMHALTCKISPDQKYYEDNVILESEVPKPFIHAIMKFMNIDENKQEDREKFEKYLLDKSHNCIVERRNLASGNQCYAFKQITNILWVTGSVPTREVVFKESSVEKCIVSFSLALEFNNNSSFIMDIPESFDYKSLNQIDGKDNFVFNFTVPVNFIKEVRDGDGLTLLYKKKFICDMNEDIEVLPFKAILSNDILRLLEDNETRPKIMRENLMDIDLYSNSRLLDKSEYSIDWNKYEIKLYKPTQNENYYFCFYGDLEILNGMLRDLDEYEITRIKKK